ncbi:MAG: hypothetical protein ACRDN9_19250 [Streptosporangiaceae bacterium]
MSGFLSPITRRLDRPVALYLPDDMIPGIKGFMEPYMKLIDRGTRPAVVLHSRSKDQAYLASRGIEKVVTLDEV